MIRQRTIREPVSIEGIGLQTGAKTRLNFKSAPANSGINFIRVDLPGKPRIDIGPLPIGDTSSNKRRTIVSKHGAQVQTTEHLMAALSGLGIDNISIEINAAELPGLDGSAEEYVKALELAGIVEQDAEKKLLKIERPVWCSYKDSFLAAFPYDGYRVSYYLSYPAASIGDQFLSLDISQDAFKRQIAPARTFCMRREAVILKLLGFGKGANSENTLIMGNKGPLNNVLRFPDEPVRHKILDLIGDLYLLGSALHAHIIGVKSGHRLNRELVKKLKGE